MTTSRHHDTTTSLPTFGKHIWGTSRDEELEGGMGDDIIYGGGGDDTVFFTWNSGHDIFHGQSGNCTVHLYGPGMTRDSFTVKLSTGEAREHEGSLMVSPNATGLITLTDGCTLEFHQVSRITWSPKRNHA